MNNRLSLILSVIETVIGALAIVSFVILAISGENMINWIPPLILSILLVIIGVTGIISSVKKNRSERTRGGNENVC